MIGVSPAYFLSRYGESFTPAQVAEGLQELAGLGFDNFQLEIFHAESLGEWASSGAGRVAAEAKKHGLAVSQFVAHFMLHYFSTPEEIRSDHGFDEMDRVISILSHFPRCSLVTIPLGAFHLGAGAGASTGGAVLDYPSLYERFLDKLRTLLRKVESSGRKCAIELIPGAFISGTDGVRMLFDEPGLATLGFNFDTGHANAAKECISAIPYKLQGRLYGTHLCDNEGNANLSLRPGTGTVDWDGLAAALADTGYTGALDIEIRCERQQVTEEYRAALELVRKMERVVLPARSR